MNLTLNGSFALQHFECSRNTLLAYLALPNNHYLNHMELYTHGTEPKQMVVFGKEGMLTSYLDA